MASEGKPQFLMYTLAGCPYCNQAKALFDHYNVRYQVKYEKAPDWDTFPGIYKITDDGPELIGGFSELAEYSYKDGL
jgi:hypothetical protein